MGHTEHVRLLYSLLAFTLIVATATTVVTFILLRRQDTINHQLHNADEHACIRVNVLRATDNLSHYQDFLSSRGLAKVLDDQERHFSETLVSIANAKTWTPLTDCTSRASLTGTYTPAVPIAIIKMRPPLAALSIENAKRRDPIGSQG